MPDAHEDSVSRNRQESVLEVIAEELSVQKQKIVRGSVRVEKRVESRDELVDTPIVHEEVLVERIPLNRLLDDAIPTTREEAGVLIIPVIEEVLVTEKKWLIREEVRLSIQRVVEPHAPLVTLRREVVDIHRVPIQEESVEPAPPPPDLRKLSAQPEPEVKAVTSSADTGDSGDQTSASPESEGNEVVIPVLAEEFSIRKERVPRAKVQIRKYFDVAEGAIELPTMREDVVLSRETINKPIETPRAEARFEGDAIVIPLIEESFVTEKRLLLREEVRVTRRIRTEELKQKVTLRHEVVAVERIEAEGPTPRRQ